MTEQRQRTQNPQLRARYRRVLGFFFPVFLNFFFHEIFLRHTGMGKLSTRSAEKRYRQMASRFRQLAGELGGIWIKVGQFLSTRLDVLPSSITDELTGLQDEVQAEPFENVVHLIEDEWQAPYEERLAELSPETLAAASLGQVHRGKLKDGTEIVIKVQRKEIQAIIEVDLRALQVVMGWMKRYKPITRRADLNALYDEFASMVWEEVDYYKEADNLRYFREMFNNDPEIHIPEVYEGISTSRVLVMEDVYAIKIIDQAGIAEAGIDPVEVAARLINAYMRQIFEEERFHADPHPGNLFVEPVDEETWRLVFVDFGMVGTLPEEVKGAIREALVAVVLSDLDRLMDAYQDLGLILPGANMERIKEAEGALLERFWGKSMRELSELDLEEMRSFAATYVDLLYELPIQVPNNLMFLGRCVAILSGLCTGLDPDFNPFDWLVPYTKRMISDEKEAWFEILLEQIRKHGSILVGLPQRLDSALDQLETGSLVVMAKPAPEVADQLNGFARLGQRMIYAILSCGCMSAAAILYVGGQNSPAALFTGLAALTVFLSLKKPGR